MGGFFHQVPSQPATCAVWCQKSRVVFHIIPFRKKIEDNAAHRTHPEQIMAFVPAFLQPRDSLAMAGGPTDVPPPLRCHHA